MCGLILNIDLWVVNRCVFDLPHPPLFLSQHMPSLLLANMLFESIASAFLISNWGSLVCTGECKERISVLIWQSGKQQYATVQNWVKIPNLYFLCKASERRFSEYPHCPGKRSNTVPVLYRELTESQHCLVSADLPGFPQQTGLHTPCWIPESRWWSTRLASGRCSDHRSDHPRSSRLTSETTVGV